MKGRLLSILVLFVLGTAVAFMMISAQAEKRAEYNGYLSSAIEQAKKEIPYMSVLNYKRAFELKCDDEKVYRDYIEQAKLLGEDFYEEAVMAYSSYFPNSPDAYELLCEVYYEDGNYKKVIETALAAREKNIASERTRELYLECNYMFRYLHTGLDEAQSFLGTIALAWSGGVYAYMDIDGSYVLMREYEHAGPMLNGFAAVEDAGQWYMINSAGYMVARPDQEVDYLSLQSGGLVLVGKNGGYSYMGSTMRVPETFPYEEASVFKSGVSAVKKNGKWALMAADASAVTDYLFDDVIRDEFNACVGNGIIFASQNGKYRMYDLTGQPIGGLSFDDAKPFASEAPAAVCINGKWGFVDQNGEMVIEPQYDEADSFSFGLGGVLIDGKWGYISQGGEMRIEPQFDACKPFSSNGIAAVKEGDMWSYIKLISAE